MRKCSELEVKEKVEIALSMLLKNDAFLLEHDVNERSISHKLAEYLQQLFSDYHVDCEYNKNNEMPKYINNFWNKVKIKDPLVYPDINVHLRNTNINVLVIEIKKSTNKDLEERDFDLVKLKAYLSKGDEYCYQFGVFVDLPCGKNLSSQEYSLKIFSDEDEINFESKYYGKV